MNFARRHEQQASEYPLVGESVREAALFSADHDPAVRGHDHLRVPQMHPLLSRSTIAFGVVLAAGMINAASAQNSASTPANEDLKARCNQLLSMYDRYGSSQSGDSDGARNHTRIGAGIDCANSRAAQGVAAMENLLKGKNYDMPAPLAGVAQSPSTTAAPRQ
jgi:hypothetical protein